MWKINLSLLYATTHLTIFERRFEESCDGMGMCIEEAHKKWKQYSCVHTYYKHAGDKMSTTWILSEVID